MEDVYPEDGVFDISFTKYDVNPYKVQIGFPYPNSSYPVLNTTVKCDQMPKFYLDKPFMYLFDTQLKYEGEWRLLEDEAEEEDELSELDLFMEQTRYLVCLVQDK